RQRVRLRLLAYGARGLFHLPLERVEVGADVVFHSAGVLLLRSATLLDDALRIADLLANAFIANAAGRFVELARRVLLVGPHLIGQLLELRLQIGNLCVHRLLALTERLRLRIAAGAGRRLIEAVDVGRHFLLLVREILSLPLNLLQIAIVPTALIALQAL